MGAVSSVSKRRNSAAAANAACFPPWSTLYPDALHSIFKFASLADLTRLMSVSRRWGEAVMTMPPIAAPAFARQFNPAQLGGLLDSRVRRHVTSILSRGGWRRPLSALSAAQLQHASLQAPWLSDLAAAASTADAEMMSEALPRFTKLCRLHIVLPFAAVSVAACNRIIETIGALAPATVNHLALHLPSETDQLSFAPLLALTQLRLFSLGANGWSNPPPLTDAQIRDLRAMTSLHKLTTPYKEGAETDMLVRMLQADHALQWNSLGAERFPILVTSPLAVLLSSLPTVTTLHVRMSCADVQFFAQLPRLTDLELDGRFSGVDPAALVSSLRSCTLLTRLRLRFVDLASRHLEGLLPAFPLLSSLTLMRMDQLDSLRCFATPALAASLKALILSILHRCPPSELSQLFGLRSLQSVEIDNLARPLTAEDTAPFRVPSQIFPALQSSELPYSQPDAHVTDRAAAAPAPSRSTA